LTRTGVLAAALVATPVLGAIATAVYGDPAGDALPVVAGWTVFVGIVVAIAWVDLRRPQSRGQVAFGVAGAAIVFAAAALILAGFIALPALCLILIAASLGHRVRLVVATALLGAGTLVYAGGLMT
jgi:riboflavin transporter FmnP